MFKKTKVKQILSMIFLNASNHLISKTLSVSSVNHGLILYKREFRQKLGLNRNDKYAQNRRN